IAAPLPSLPIGFPAQSPDGSRTHKTQNATPGIAIRLREHPARDPKHPRCLPTETHLSPKAAGAIGLPPKIHQCEILTAARPTQKMTPNTSIPLNVVGIAHRRESVSATDHSAKSTYQHQKLAPQETHDRCQTHSPFQPNQIAHVHPASSSRNTDTTIDVLVLTESIPHLE